MSINLSNAFKALYNIKGNLLSDFKTLKFIGQDSNNQRVYLGTVNNNWQYREIKNPENGLIDEKIYFSPATTQQSQWAENATGFELVKADNSYLRFTKLEGVLSPKPPRYDWRFTVSPNRQDTGVL